MKRRILVMLLFIVMPIFCFFGCAKAVTTEITIVDATVVNTNYKKEWTQFIWNGKSLIPIHHRAKYKVTIEYENYKIAVDDKDLYEKYNDNIGATVKCNLITIYYDDGTSKTKLKWEDDND